MTGEPGQPGETNDPDKQDPVVLATVAGAKWTKRATVTTIISTVIALVAGAIAFYSAHLVAQQNTNAQQQELTTIVTNIVQGQQVAGSTQTSTVSTQIAALGEGEEANNIIHGLPGSDVSPVERYIVGLALEDGEDYETALPLLRGATQDGQNPRVSADAWRAVAAANYALGHNKTAEHDITQAIRSFDRYGPTSASQEGNIAYNDLFDATYRVGIGDCSTALSEWDRAARLTERNPSLLAGSNAVTTAEHAMDALEDKHACDVRALKVMYVSGSALPQAPPG
jgi:tetratricopeptide (TPR) repeat protein